MKYLVKIFIVFVGSIMAFDDLFAQNIGLKGGLNLSNMFFKEDGETYSEDFKMRPGFNIGATAEFPLSEMFSFETGLLLSTKGFNHSLEYSLEDTEIGESIKLETNISLLYLDIPFVAKSSFDLGYDKKIYATFGPYVGIGIIGTRLIKLTYDGETESDGEFIEWGSEESSSYLKRLDFGLSIGAGVEINSVLIGLNYSLGLANISPNTDNGNMINNRVLGLSVGYKFSRY